MPGTRDERPRRNPLFGVFIGGGFGLFSLATGLSRPTIANMRTLDLVHLIATGMCLGVALASVVHYFVRRREAGAADAKPVAAAAVSTSL